jgi:hypothetical protein
LLRCCVPCVVGRCALSIGMGSDFVCALVCLCVCVCVLVLICVCFDTACIVCFHHHCALPRTRERERSRSYHRPPWVHCELESPELLALCLKKMTGLQVRALWHAMLAYWDVDCVSRRVVPDACGGLAMM